MSQPTSPRRSFTEEFKRDAVQLTRERGNVSAVARELGIGESCLNRWKRALEQPAPGQAATRPFPGKGNPRDEEMATIQRENARLKQENEILKKAVGIFTSRPLRDALARRR